jgi:hypothetical protein
VISTGISYSGLPDILSQVIHGFPQFLYEDFGHDLRVTSENELN